MSFGGKPIPFYPHESIMEFCFKVNGIPFYPSSHLIKMKFYSKTEFHFRVKQNLFYTSPLPPAKCINLTKKFLVKHRAFLHRVLSVKDQLTD